jgi:hypothetical protein
MCHIVGGAALVRGQGRHAGRSVALLPFGAVEQQARVPLEI